MPAPGSCCDGFRILHADSWLVVLEKATGLLSVPGLGPGKADCLAARAAAIFPGARIVHRLDRDTSGVIVLALDAATHRALSIQFQERRTSKRYIAIVGGDPPLEGGEVELPIRKDLDDPPRQRVDFEHGRPSVTRWRLLRRGARAEEVVDPPRSRTSRADLSGSRAASASADAVGEQAPQPVAGVGIAAAQGDAAQGDDDVTPMLAKLPSPAPYARLELEPLTGRGHQLRVHLRSIGLPILGDDLYAPPELRPPGLRLLLHASMLSFTHPASGRTMVVEAPAPF